MNTTASVRFIGGAAVHDDDENARLIRNADYLEELEEPSGIVFTRFDHTTFEVPDSDRVWLTLL